MRMPQAASRAFNQQTRRSIDARLPAIQTNRLGGFAAIDVRNGRANAFLGIFFHMGRRRVSRGEGICAGVGHIDHDAVGNALEAFARLEDALLRVKGGLLGIRDQSDDGAFGEATVRVLRKSHFGRSAAKAMTVEFNQCAVWKTDDLGFDDHGFAAAHATDAEREANCGQTDSYSSPFYAEIPPGAHRGRYRSVCPQNPQPGTERPDA